MLIMQLDKYIFVGWKWYLEWSVCDFHLRYPYETDINQKLFPWIKYTELFPVLDRPFKDKVTYTLYILLKSAIPFAEAYANTEIWPLFRSSHREIPRSSLELQHLDKFVFFLSKVCQVPICEYMLVHW